MAAVKIVAVEGPKEMQRFLDLPWKIYAGDPKWVPPLKNELRRLLDPQAHPFWKFSQRRLLLAQRGDETVGRIAGIVDHNYNRFHDENMAIWGFFECAADREAAAALFSAVEEWARQQGMTFLRGPLNPSTNYEIGLLIEGFESPPVFMMTYNPPYYPNLVESAGFKKEKDLLAFRVERGWQPPEWVEQMARHIKEKDHVYVRPLNLKKFQEELLLVKEIYHEAWFDNWGFVPMTDAEFAEMGKNLFRIVDPALVFFLYYEEEPVGVGVIVPDINPVLRHLNGRIGLLGWLKILLYRRQITGFRGLIFGIRKKYQALGLPLVAFDYLYGILREKTKYQRYKYIELGWNLEDNDLINQWYEDGGARVNKKFRLFRKSW